MPLDRFSSAGDAGPSTRRALLVGALGAAAAACTPAGPDVLPDASLPGLPGLMRNGWPVPGIGERQFLGRVSLVNVWASWCPYCRGEHDALMRLSQDGRFTLVGLVHKDTPEKALAFLKQAGNPFAAVSLSQGAFTELGRRGLPTTYVVDRQAHVRLRLVGGLDEGRIRGEVLPLVRNILSA